MRIRITPEYRNQKGTEISYTEVKAEMRSIGQKGLLETKYLPKGKFDEMVENGFAYTNQPKRRIF